MSTLSNFKSIMTTIRKHPIIFYLVLWAISSIVIYLLIGKLLFSLLLSIGAIVNGANWPPLFLLPPLFLGCAIAGIILIFKKRKQHFRTEFITLSFSFGGIFILLDNIIWGFIMRQINIFVGSIMMGAGIAGAIMIYVVLIDNKEKEICLPPTGLQR